ncbi:hypothetical protein M378DRAFT_819459 [Amanita muscaria Koide BX008]|uniref:Uncharacterized protein n=1 Tax=Amanita muscaria (strain Koide BX008) TaxID=946122 RepID=A0A0C2T561_AMAMK|nr:hypothetical protein M378DRAFT_819459 [Amanita muscaria Koide BX008]
MNVALIDHCLGISCLTNHVVAEKVVGAHAIYVSSPALICMDKTGVQRRRSIVFHYIVTHRHVTEWRTNSSSLNESWNPADEIHPVPTSKTH